MEYHLDILKRAASAIPYPKTFEIRMQLVNGQSAGQSVCQTFQNINNAGVQGCAATRGNGKSIKIEKKSNLGVD